MCESLVKKNMSFLFRHLQESFFLVWKKPSWKHLKTLPATFMLHSFCIWTFVMLSIYSKSPITYTHFFYYINTFHLSSLTNVHLTSTNPPTTTRYHYLTQHPHHAAYQTCLVGLPYHTYISTSFCCYLYKTWQLLIFLPYQLLCG